MPSSPRDWAADNGRPITSKSKPTGYKSIPKSKSKSKGRTISEADAKKLAMWSAHAVSKLLGDGSGDYAEGPRAHAPRGGFAGNMDQSGNSRFDPSGAYDGTQFKRSIPMTTNGGAASGSSISPANDPSTYTDATSHSHYNDRNQGAHSSANPHAKAVADSAVGNIMDLVRLISGAMPQAPQAPTGYSPALVDVNATLKPFADARVATRSEYDSNKLRLAELAKGGIQDNQMVQAATQARLGDLEKMRRMVQAQDAAGARTDAGGAIVDLQAQGVDPSLVAAAQDQQRAASNTAANASNAGLNMIADQKSQANIEAARQARDLQSADRGAQTNLDASLFRAMAGIQGQELDARTKAEQYNAQAQQEAAQAGFQGQQANYQSQLDQFDRMSQLPGAIGQSAEQLGAYGFPQRAKVLDEINSTMNTKNGVGFVLNQSLSSADNPDDALSSVMNGLAQINKDREKKLQPKLTPSMTRIQSLINNYYAQDGSLTNQGFSQLAQLFGALKGYK